MESTTVTSHPLVALLGFGAVVVLLLVLIARWKWHVFLALLIPLLLFGLVPGIQRNQFIGAFERGFGDTLGKIGVVIVLGSIMAEALKHTGAIQAITLTMVRWVGFRRMPLALTLTGFVVGVAIFSDVAYVILNPLVHSAAHTMGAGVAVVSIGLVGAVQLTHAIVPPTPGPLAAAALVGADIGKVILFGGLACLMGSLAAWIWGQYLVGPRIPTPPAEEFIGQSFLDRQTPGALPGVLNSYAPIVIPILLIAGRSLSTLTLPEGNWARQLLAYLGWPVVALAIGVGLACWNIRTAEDRKKARTAWVEDGLRISAMILVVTGLGGSLSEILEGTPAVTSIAQFFATHQLPSILLPFVLGIIGNMITGSSTVGVITAGSLVAPMLGTLNLSPEAAMLSGASGSVIFKYVNSSYFWICTSLSQLEVRDAIVAYGGATLMGGLVSFLTVCGLWMGGWI